MDRCVHHGDLEKSKASMKRRLGARAARRSLMAAVFEYLEANTPGQIRDCLSRHPELLDEPAEAVLGELIQAARQRGRDDIAATLAERRALLMSARVDEGHAKLSGELRQALTEIHRLGADADPRRRIGLLREMLARPDLAPHAELQAALQGMLGASLSEQADSDDYEEAIAVFQASLTVHTRTSAPHSWLVTTLNLGKVYARRAAGLRAENIETAIKCFSEVLAAGDDALAGQRAEAGVELAAAYLDRVEGSRSDNIEQAIVSSGAVLTGVGAATAAQSGRARRILGRAYLRRFEGKRADNIEQAIEYLDAAAALYTAREFPDEWAGVHCDLGMAFRERIVGIPAKNFARAIEHFQAVIESAAHARSVAHAIALNGVGTVYAVRMDGDREQDLESAIACFVEASEIFAERGLAIELAAVQHGLGDAYMQRLAGNWADNVERAIGFLEDALAVRTRQELPLDWAQTQHSLGNAYSRRGYGDRAHNVELAIAAFTAAKAEFADLGATRQEAVTQQSLGQAYFNRVIGNRAANLEHAVSNLRAAQTVFAAQSMVAEQAAALTGLGNACSEGASDAVDQAIGYHCQAIDVLGNSSAYPDVWAIVQNNLGTAYLERHSARRQADLTAAIVCLDDSLNCGSATWSSLEQAMTQHNLGAAYTERARQTGSDDLRLAITHFEIALEVFAAVGLALYRRGTGQALGDAYARLGDQWPSAFRAYATALEASDDLYASSLRREAKEGELVATPGLHLRAGHAAAKTGQLNQAVAILERGRARGSGEALARDLAELGQIEDLDGALTDAFAAAAAEVRQLEATEWRIGDAAHRRDVTGIVLSDRQAYDADAGDELQQKLAAARARLASAVDQIRHLDGHERFLAQPEFDDVVGIVTRAGPLAYVAVTDYGSLTLVVAESRDGGSSDGRPGPAAELIPEPAEPLTSGVLHSMLIRSDDDGVITGGYLPAQLETTFPAGVFRKELENLLPVLGERLAAPLARHLTAIRTDAVTLVACGLLGLLPLHAATYQRDGETEQRCLLDDFAVSYIPSARLLDAVHIALAALSSQPRQAPALVGVGNPDHSSPLPFAQAELKEISAFFPTARAFYGKQATKTALIESAPGATYVHLACHGYFDAASPRDSALGLARESGADRLTLTEIVTDRPFAGARLVTASACETAITDFTQLPDEVIGLPSGFIQAGSAGVVGTLWKVNDASTALLMTRFYEYHLVGDQHAGEGPMSPAMALRRAQLWLARISSEELEPYYEQHRALRDARDGEARPGLDSPSRRPYAHPWYWAAFVFVGA